MNWTVTVQHEGQMVPGMRLWIQVFDTYANTYSEFSGTTSSAGAYSVSRSFECSTVDNAIHFAIVARLIRSDGYVGQGSSHSGARSCTSGPGGTTLGLAVAFPGTYDRDNAAGCGVGEPVNPSNGVGKPVNPSNGNMFVQQADFALRASVGEPIVVSRTYNSIIQGNGMFGFGWTSDLDEKLVRNCATPSVCYADFMLFYAPDGRIYHFKFKQSLGNQTDLYEPITPGIKAKVHRYVVGAGSAEIIFQDGRIHHFDNWGRFLWRKDRNGNQTNYTYNGSGRMTGVTDPFGRTLTVTTNATTGRITDIRDPLGIIATYSYNGSLLQTVTYSDGSKHQFEYLTVGGKTYLATVKDALGNTTETHQYDSQGRATTSEIHGGAEQYSLDYSNANLTVDPHTIVTDGLGRVSKYYYDKSRGRNALIKSEGTCSCGGGGSETTTFEYDAKLNLTKRTDALLNDTTYTYDADSNVLTRTGVFGSEQFTYNSFGQVLTYRDRIDSQNSDPNVKTAILAYDANGNITSHTDALGKVTTIAYPVTNNKGLPDSVTDARDNQTKFKWFATSSLLQEIEDPYTKKTNFTYDVRGRTKTVTNALTHVTSYNYFDDTQRKVEMIYPNSDKITYKYDIRRTLESVTDERGKITTYEFDPQYRLKKITDPLSHVKEFGYDLMSNMTSYKDPLGNITDYRFDDFDRLKEIEHPAATIGATRLKEKFEYDKLARLTKYYDTADRLTEYGYNDATRTNTVTNAELETTQIKYNQRFQTFEVKDARNQTYTFAYDPLGRMLSQTRAGATMSFDYDSVGNLERRTDYLGRETEYTHDNLNRLTQIEYLPTGLGTSTFSNYGYDDISRLTSATNDAGAVIFAYDNRNRMTSTTDVFNHTVAYEYERTSTVNQQRLKFDGAMYAVYNFDNAERLNSIVNSSDSSTITFGYDNEDKLTSRAYPNGITTSYEYFDNDLLKRVVDSNASSDLFDRQYTYNTARQISQIVEPSRTRSFGYDNVDRLTSVTDATYGNESYAFDDVGNRTSSHLSTIYGYQSGQLNRLTSTDTATYQFDANGNTTQKDDGVDIWGFAWDHENRMTTATVGTDSAVYTYDALGRRVRRNVGGGVQDTKFIHDGHDVLVDDDGGTLTKYLNGEGIDNKLRVQQGSTVNYFLGDHLGSTNALADAAGAITSQTDYDSFGNQTGSLATRYGFTGRERDDFTGLMYYRARFYDPNVGRFMSEDPIGFAGGDVNLYGYVRNRPHMLRDPSGENPVVVIVVVVLIVTSPSYVNAPGPADPVYDSHSPLVENAVMGCAGGLVLRLGGGALLGKLFGPRAGNIIGGSADDALAGAFKPFTRRNFRFNLGQHTGEVPVGSHAHHVFPDEFADDFLNAGINPHNPRFGAWWDAGSHLRNAHAYNQEWANFFAGGARSQAEIVQFGREIMSRYGLTVGF